MPSKVVMHGKQRIFDGFFKIDEAELSYERFDGEMTPMVKRLCFERGDSVAAIVKHRNTGDFIFLRQFRYPRTKRVRAGSSKWWRACKNQARSRRCRCVANCSKRSDTRRI
jgi:hypothetical protein